MEIEIYPQRIDADATIHTAWAFGGVAISTRAGEQTAPQLASDGSGSAIIARKNLRGTYRVEPTFHE